MKKNLLSGLLAGVMAVSLVACGNSESTPAADSTTETAKPATAENSDTLSFLPCGLMPPIWMIPKFPVFCMTNL